jgi:hypothetical protein
LESSSRSIWNSWFGRRSGGVIPFKLRESGVAEDAAAELFRRTFGSPAPSVPRHFVAELNRQQSKSIHGYVHFTVFEPGVFLCGGLCIDTRIYRSLNVEERAALARQGSLSRWLLNEAIEALGPKRAVFAYTGDTRSRRDVTAIGFGSTSNFHFVQWHSEPVHLRAELVRRVEALGPF